MVQMGLDNFLVIALLVLISVAISGVITGYFVMLDFEFVPAILFSIPCTILLMIGIAATYTGYHTREIERNGMTNDPFKVQEDKQQFQMIPIEKKIETGDKTIQIDANNMALEVVTEFRLIVCGVDAGKVTYDPLLSKYGFTWMADIGSGNTSYSCSGIGNSPDEAIRFATTHGAQLMRDAVSFAAKIGTQIKRNPKRAKLVTIQEKD